MTTEITRRNKPVATVLITLGALVSVAGGVHYFYQKNIVKERIAKELAVADAALAHSERMRVKAELESRSARDDAISKIRESADHGLIELDGQGRVIDWNTAVEKWTGYGRQEMIGRTLAQIMEPVEYERHHAAYVPWIQSEETSAKTLVLTCRLVAKDGKRRTVRVTARRVPGGDHAVAILDRPQNIVDLTGEGT